VQDFGNGLFSAGRGQFERERRFFPLVGKAASVIWRAEEDGDMRVVADVEACAGKSGFGTVCWESCCSGWACVVSLKEAWQGCAVGWSLIII